MYKSSDKICDLMSQEEDAIQIISRFGLAMGVGEQTIEQVCDTHGVHTQTFLSVVNYKLFKERPNPDTIDIPTLQRYLKNAHTYFLDFRLPRLRRALIEAIIPADPSTKIPGLILRCYDEFVAEIRTHIEHKNAGLFELRISSLSIIPKRPPDKREKTVSVPPRRAQLRIFSLVSCPIYGTPSKILRTIVRLRIIS